MTEGLPTPRSVETSAPPPSEVDAGIFTIEFFTPNLQGLRVETVDTLRRHEPNTPLPGARRINPFRDREKKEFRVGPSFKPKVGVREPVLEGNILKIKIVPVTFPTYNAIGRPEDPAEELAVSMPTGTASILETADGKLIVQHRSAKNKIYGDDIGASAAGHMDGELDKTTVEAVDKKTGKKFQTFSKDRAGKLKPITERDVISHNKEEIRQELGLSEEDIKDYRITGFAKDNVKVHTEFLLAGKTTLTSEQVQEKAKLRAQEVASQKNTGRAEFDFDEKYFVIPSTPDAIETLLTKVKNPLPPTHAAAFLAFGYTKVLEANGKQKADEWRDRVAKDTKQNYLEIDKLVQDFYAQNPEKTKDQPEGKTPRNTKGYDPAYLPQDQGLPEVVVELKRVGLII